MNFYTSNLWANLIKSYVILQNENLIRNRRSWKWYIQFKKKSLHGIYIYRYSISQECQSPAEKFSLPRKTTYYQKNHEYLRHSTGKKKKIRGIHSPAQFLYILANLQNVAIHVYVIHSSPNTTYWGWEAKVTFYMLKKTKYKPTRVPCKHEKDVLFFQISI